MPAASSRISVTAKIPAYYRHFSDITFAAEAAKRIDANGAFEQILHDHELEREKLSRRTSEGESPRSRISSAVVKSYGP